MLRTPISYYGGKQNLAKQIIELIPEHKLYCEPFIGGAAVFFGKEKSNVEVINDTNGELVNFYKVCQTDFGNLQKEVNATLHSRQLHDDAWVVYNKPHLFSPVKRAWAVWVLATQSFSSQLDGSFGYDKSGNRTTKKIDNKRLQFVEDIRERLRNTQIECADALYVINSRDTADSFFYCDPPYFNSEMGHYDGYSEDDFKNLLNTLQSIKGKFLLSSYHSHILSEYVKANGWSQKQYEQSISCTLASTRGKMKTEVLTFNYEIYGQNKNQQHLF